METQNITPNSCQSPVTDNGEAVGSPSAPSRVISYIPYGEIFVEQQSGGWQSPYLFNSKELDSETGLYYYGARYLDPTDGMWLSVDPLWEKYVGMSPYGYCAGNPVRLVDPDGNKVECSSKATQRSFVKEMNKIDGNKWLNRYYHSLEKSPLVYTINSQSGASQFAAKKVSVDGIHQGGYDASAIGMQWNDSRHVLVINFDFSVKGYNKNNRDIVWPTIAVLSHEITHAAQFDACVRIFDLGEDPSQFYDIIPELLNDYDYQNGEYSESTGAEVYGLFYSDGFILSDSPTENAAIDQETAVTKYVNPSFNYERTRQTYSEGGSTYEE